MLVTPDGRWVFPNSEEFLALLGDHAPDYDAVSFAVKNLGFIKFQIIGQSIIEIDLHPRNVELSALLAAQQQVMGCRIDLFRIQYFDTEWHSEILSSAENTVARLSELCTPISTPPTLERFIVEPRDLSVLFHDEENQMRPLAQKWRVSFGHFDPGIITLAVRHHLLSRLIIIGIRPREQEPVWRFVGDGFQWMGGTQLTLQGQKVGNISDKEYGGWAGEYYKAVAASGQPRYDLVTTQIQYENEEGKPWRPIRYERLLLPWKTGSEEVLVTMCSKLVDPGIAMPSANSASESSVIRKFAMSS
jgi:hypothetical protein